MAFSEEKGLQIVELFKENLSVKQTAEHFGCCTNAVYRQLKKHNIPLVPMSKQCDLHIDSDCFTDFTREEDAYFFGLLLADGTISDNRNHIRISLKPSDLHMLESLRDYLGSSNKIITSKRGDYVWHSLAVKSVTLKQRLVCQNLMPRKSTREQLPNFDWLHNRHFWRGVVDGDGSVFYTKGSPKLNLCGSKELLEGFNKFCQLNCFTKPRKLDKTKTEDFFTMVYSGEEAFSIMKLLYDNSRLFLKRKKARVEEYKTKYSPSNKRGISITSAGRYCVQIGFNGKRLSLGTYDTHEEALSVRLEAEIKYQGKIRDDIHSSTAA